MVQSQSLAAGACEAVEAQRAEEVERLGDGPRADPEP